MGAGARAERHDTERTEETEAGKAHALKTQTQQVLRWQSGSKPVYRADELAAEEPLEIRIDTHSVSVTMRTPGHDEELVKSRADIARIASHPRNTEGNVIDVCLSPRVTVDFAQLTRHVFASSSC